MRSDRTSRATIFLLSAAGLGLMFYGLATFRAALITYWRNEPDQTFSLTADVAREGIVYGLAIAIAGGLLVTIGVNLRRLKQRQRLLASRQKDLEASRQTRNPVNATVEERPASRHGP